MANHKSLSRHSQSLALTSALFIAAASLAFAQEAPAEEGKRATENKDATQLDRITVTGLRIYRAGFHTLELAAVVSRVSRPTAQRRLPCSRPPAVHVSSITE